MEIGHLKTFVQVAALGSISRSASVCGVAQSALSRQIACLEAEFGERLFHRTGRGVSLTEFGAAVLPRIEALVIEAEQLLEDIKAQGREIVGQVTLGVLASLSPSLLTPLLTRLRDRAPGIKMRILDGFTDRIEDWLANGRVDVGIVYGQRSSSAASGELLFMADEHLVSRPGEALTASDSVSLRRLGDLPMILPAIPNRHRMLVQRAFAHDKVPLTVTSELDFIPSIKELVAAGNGYTLLPLHAVQQEVAAGVLQVARIVRPLISRAVLLRASTQRPPSRASREVMRVIRDVTRELVASGRLPGRR